MALGNQTLGRGKIYFSLLKEGTYTPAGYRYVGNTPDFGLSISNEKLDHFSADEGIRVRDKTVILQTDATGSLTMDDIQPENLALFFFGESSIEAQGSATGLTETFADVKLGHAYKVGVTDARPTGYHSLLSVVVKVGVTTMVLNDDYTLNAELGLVTPIDGGDIVEGDDMIVEFNVGAKSRVEVISGAQQVEGSILFESYNPEGDRFDYLLPYVKLSPNGDFAIKADEWQQLPFTIEILKAPNRSAIYCNGRPYTPS